MALPGAPPYHAVLMAMNRQFANYFVPLALQSMLQCLTYPLVAMVASRGAGGAIHVAGMAQAHIIVGLILTLTAGMITTGMVYARSRAGFDRFKKINRLLVFITAGAAATLWLPWLSHGVFGKLLGLSPLLEQSARLNFLAALPLLVLFGIRIPYLVVLYNGKATGQAFGAAAGRILLTLLLSPLFCLMGAVGPIWANVCLVIPLALEVLVTRYFAGPLIARLHAGTEAPPRISELLTFSFTLSVGAVFLSLAGFMVGAFSARALEPERMLPVYYLVMGVATPLALGMIRIQPLVLTFHGVSPRQDAQLWRFTLLTGMVAGALPLVLLLPPLAELYYVKLQKLAPGDLALVAQTAGCLILYPLAVGLRAYSEGCAARVKKPMAVMTGQAVLLSVVAIVSFASLNLGLPGNLIGALAVTSGNVLAAGTVLMALRWDRRGAMPVQPTAETPVVE